MYSQRRKWVKLLEREIKIEKNLQPGAHRGKRYNNKPVSTTSKLKGITDLLKHA